MHLAERLAAEAKPVKSCCKSGIPAPKPGNAMVGKCCCQLVPNLAPEANKPTTLALSLSMDLSDAPRPSSVAFDEPISTRFVRFEPRSERGPPGTHFPACGLRAPPILDLDVL
jgi:hypothetical protein